MLDCGMSTDFRICVGSSYLYCTNSLSNMVAWQIMTTIWILNTQAPIWGHMAGRFCSSDHSMLALATRLCMSCAARSRSILAHPISWTRPSQCRLSLMKTRLHRALVQVPSALQTQLFQRTRHWPALLQLPNVLPAQRLLEVVILGTSCQKLRWNKTTKASFFVSMTLYV